MSWSSIALLANVELIDAIDTKYAAFVPTGDPRVHNINEAHPNHAAFLNRFTDAFGKPVCPTVLLVSSSAPNNYRSYDAIASFRDILSVSVIPRARARYIQSISSSRIYYSNVFDLYPWMLNKDYDQLVSFTPAMGGFQEIINFNGQASPEIHYTQLTDSQVDKNLFEGLINHWYAAYNDEKTSWKNTKLMRSLNMSYQASQSPGDQVVTVFDYGRVIALWVSAFEILVHPGNVVKSKKLCEMVCKLLDADIWKDNRCKEISRTLYKKIYNCRNDFLHGNRIDIQQYQTQMTSDSLYGVVAALYRMALISFLNLNNLDQDISDKITFEQSPTEFEKVILQCSDD